MRVYLDYNVYDAIRKKRIPNFMEISKDKYYISVAHVEEYYNEVMNDDAKQHLSDHENIKELLDHYKTNGVLNPTAGHRIQNKKENFDDAFERVKEYDTREFVREQGAVLNETIKQQNNEYHTENPQSKNYSNLSEIEIWEVPEIQQKLDEFPKYLEEYDGLACKRLKEIYGPVRAYLTMQKTGKLPFFSLEKGCGMTIKENFQQLEMAIEFLHKTLCDVGYNSDKGVRKNTSGIHDTSHSIYGTYCEVFVTNDKKFSKRLQAVYAFLGLNVKVMSLDTYMSSLD